MTDTVRTWHRVPGMRTKPCREQKAALDRRASVIDGSSGATTQYNETPACSYTARLSTRSSGVPVQRHECLTTYACCWNSGQRPERLLPEALVADDFVARLLSGRVGARPIAVRAVGRLDVECRGGGLEGTW